jgi:hypothetical protein
MNTWIATAVVIVMTAVAVSLPAKFPPSSPVSLSSALRVPIPTLWWKVCGWGGPTIWTLPWSGCKRRRAMARLRGFLARSGGDTQGSGQGSTELRFPELKHNGFPHRNDALSVVLMGRKHLLSC